MTCQSVNGKCVKKAKSCGEGKIEDESAKCADKSKKCCVEGKKGKKKHFKNLNVMQHAKTRLFSLFDICHKSTLSNFVGK